MKLAEGTDAAVVREKKPGTLRVGVPEITNKTSQTIDTRAMRARLVAELEEQKIDVVPMAAGTQSALDARAKAMGVDYLLIAEIIGLEGVEARPAHEHHEEHRQRGSARHHRSEVERAAPAARRQTAPLENQ